MTNINYHLDELEISLSNDDTRKIIPNILDSEDSILDIGCGIGQTFITLNCFDRECIGLDIDQEVIEYAKEKYGDKIKFIHASAEKIPLEANSLNLIFSRVTLPYTNIPKVILEMKRLLKINGRIWITLHLKEKINKSIKDAFPFKIKKLIHSLYILFNGYSLKYFGVLFPFINKKYESWQDPNSMKKLLIKHGFTVKIHKHPKHIVIEGFLKPLQKNSLNTF